MDRTTFAQNQAIVAGAGARAPSVGPRSRFGIRHEHRFRRLDRHQEHHPMVGEVFNVGPLRERTTWPSGVDAGANLVFRRRFPDCVAEHDDPSLQTPLDTDIH